MTALRREGRCVPRVVPELLSFWLCHRENLSNPASRRRFDHALDAVRDDVGAAAWGDTGEQLDALRERVAGSPPRR